MFLELAKHWPNVFTKHYMMNEQTMMNIPNTLTLSRIALIPIFVVAFYLPFQWGHKLSAIIFALAAITDYLDGLLARVLKQTSSFGAFLDPVADKLMVAVALVLITAQAHSAFIAIPAAIIVSREIIISALREWMAEMGKRASVAVSFVGKIKTTIQMLAVILLLAYPARSHFALNIVSYLLLYLAVFMTLWSMVMYLKAAWEDLVNS